MRELSGPEKLEKAYRGMISGMLGMVRGYRSLMVIRKSRGGESLMQSRAIELRKARSLIEQHKPSLSAVRKRITWKIPPYILRRERELEKALKEAFLEEWRTQ